MYVNFNKICSTYSVVDNETGISELEFDAKPCTSPMSNYAGLAAVTTVASAACHRTHVHYARVLSALHSRGTATCCRRHFGVTSRSGSLSDAVRGDAGPSFVGLWVGRADSRLGTSHCSPVYAVIWPAGPLVFNSP